MITHVNPVVVGDTIVISPPFSEVPVPVSKLSVAICYKTLKIMFFKKIHFKQRLETDSLIVRVRESTGIIAEHKACEIMKAGDWFMIHLPVKNKDRDTSFLLH